MKYKYKYKHLVIFLILISFIFNTSCSGGKKFKESEAGKKEITIYILCSKDASRYSFAWGSYDGIKVNPVYFNNDLEKLQNELYVELMVAEGPDVVCTTDDRTTNIVKSVYKLANSNTFIDLNPYIKADKTYKASDYNKLIMDSGIFNGKRLFIPRLYDVPALTTTKEKLEENNIKISGDRWSWEEMISVCKKFINDKKDKRQALIFDTDNQLFIDMVANSRIGFIDFETKSTKFNSLDFVNLLKDYKNYIYPAIMKDNNSNEKALEADSNLSIIKSSPTLGDPLDYVDYMGDEKNAIPFLLPSYGNGDVIGVAREMFGITSKCKYKQAAYDFIQNIVKSTYMNIGVMPLEGVPVYKPLFNEKMGAVEGKVKLTVIGMHPTRVLNSYEDNFFNIISDNVSEVRLNDKTINDMITSAVDKYIRGSITAEQASIEIDRKAKLFLNE